MNEVVTFVAPVCSCCAEPKALLPRDDLPGQVAVCPQSGMVYRAEGRGYVATAMPELTGVYRPLPSVRIDLDRAGYA